MTNDEYRQNLGELADVLRQGKDNPEKRLVIFAGAALSMAGPSYLPPARPLVEAVLDALFTHGDIQSVFRLAGLESSTLVASVLEKSLVPEIIYQDIKEVGGRRAVLEALRALDAKEPNSNHQLLAKLTGAGLLRLLVTTNFDSLIEKALAAQSQTFEVHVGDEIPLKKIRAAFEELENPEPVQLWKIHGDVVDIDNPARSEKLVTTLDQVGKPLSQGMAERLEAALQDKNALFVGYSANDVDLAGKICALSFKRLFWNTLDKDRGKNAAIVRAMELHTDRCRWLVGDLNELFGNVAKELGMYEEIASKNPTAFKRISQAEWNEQIVGRIQQKMKAWVRDSLGATGQRRKIEIAIELQQRIGAHREATKLGRVALGSYPELSGMLLLAIGRSYSALGDITNAEESLRQSLRMLEEGGHLEAQAWPLTELAGLLRERGDVSTAADYLRRALTIGDQARNPSAQANAWMGFAATYLRLGDAPRVEECCLQAQKIFVEMGSLEGQAWVFSTLGSLHRALGDWSKVDECLKKALEFAMIAGDARAQGTTLNQLGESLRVRGELDDAESYYRKALQLYTQAGDLDGQGAVWNNLGEVERLRGDLVKAEDYQRRSIQIHRRIQDVDGEAGSWMNLGNVCRDGQNAGAALACYYRALDLYRRIQKIRGEAMVLQNMGSVQVDMPGQLTVAKQSFQRALEIYSRVSDKWGQAASYANLGFIGTLEGNLELARRLYQKAYLLFNEVGDKARAAAAQRASREIA